MFLSTWSGFTESIFVTGETRVKGSREVACSDVVGGGFIEHDRAALALWSRDEESFWDAPR